MRKYAPLICQIPAAVLLFFAALACLCLYRYGTTAAAVQTVTLPVTKSSWPYLSESVRIDTTYSYDGSGNLIREDEYRNGEYSGYTLYTLNPDGEPVIRAEYEPDGSLSDWTVCTFDDAGLLIEEVCRDGENTLLYTILYTYDASGLLLTQTRYQTDPDSEIAEQTEYVRDDAGILLSSRTYTRSTGNRYAIYSTDGDGQISGYTEYDEDGLETLQVVCERDTYGAVTAVYYEDALSEEAEQDAYTSTYVRDEEGRLLQETRRFNGAVEYEITYSTMEVSAWDASAAAAGREAGSVLTDTELDLLTEIREAELEWTFEEQSGTLTISGSGEMIWATDEWAPWMQPEAEDGSPVPVSAVKTIVVESGITSIRSGACTYPELTAVTLPDSVTVIHSHAFMNTALREISLPEGLSAIEAYTFYMCGSLMEVYIPSGVTVIRTGAFEGCSSLTDIWYGGTESDWEAVAVWDGNAALEQAAVHVNASGLASQGEACH